MELLDKLSQSLQQGDPQSVAAMTQQAIEAQIPAQEILDGGLIAGMTIIGRQFKAHEIFLPDVLLAAKAMYAGLDLLKPIMTAEEIAGRGRVVIGTVQGDLHDIGKNLVGIMLKGAGYEVIDLGSDVSAEQFVDSAVSNGASIIGLSALLTTTMPVMRSVVDLIRERNLQDQIRVIVGGAPLSTEYATEIGADAYGFDGVKAVELVSDLLHAER